MIVYAVACWESYYPSPDNVLKVFVSEQKALEFKMEQESKKSGRYANFDIFEYEAEERE